VATAPSVPADAPSFTWTDGDQRDIAANRAVSVAQAVSQPHTFSEPQAPVVAAAAQPVVPAVESPAPVEVLHAPQPTYRPRRSEPKPGNVRKMRGLSDRAIQAELSKPHLAAPRPARTPNLPSTRTTVASKVLSFGALLFAGAMVVAVSVPAAVFATPDSTTALTSAEIPVSAAGQSLPTTETSQVSAPVERDTFSMSSVAELQQTSTIRVDASYTVDNSGDVRWPFPVAVPISDGYGARVSPCSGCSSAHKGTDFTPGEGTAIAAIADGVVSEASVSAWGFGNHVFIDHVINGQKVTTVYAHMRAGSTTLQVGDVIKKGDFIGLVGATGAATGPHLHFEVRLDGVQVDPFAWLKANTAS
jgi:murein DD-endopeptidase MepM/ murein hydrolase activator NlpD